ncbi:MAG: hypothetical protein AAGI92_02090 [Pseudomonadota bacterium]
MAQKPGSNNPIKTDCGSTAPEATHALSEDQRVVLSVMRLYFMSYATPHMTCWENGIEAAVSAYGSHKGPRIAYCCLTAVQKMRTSRKNAFNFCNPFCECCRKRMSQHEAQFLQILQALEDRQHGRVELTAMMLCEGNECSEFIAALRELSLALKDNYGPEIGALM